MPKYWTEAYDPERHRNPMNWGWDAPGAPGIQRHLRAPTLEPHQVMFVRVCGFTFEFHSIDQVRVCLAYYSQKLHPSSRLDVSRGGYGGDQGETQRWFERLPLYLREESKRPLVAKALSTGLEQFERETTT